MQHFLLPVCASKRVDGERRTAFAAAAEATHAASIVCEIRTDLCRHLNGLNGF